MKIFKLRKYIFITIVISILSFVTFFTPQTGFCENKLIYVNSNDTINKLNLIDSIYNYMGLEKEYKKQKSKAELLIVDLWLNYYLNNEPFKRDFLDKYEANIWEYFFYNIYLNSNKQNDLYILKLNFIIGSLYHSQEKFSKATFLLDKVYKNYKKGNEKIYRATLMKLEECYRIKKDFKKSIEIRNIRIDNKFINTYWEIYKDFYLYDLAIENFNNYEVLPTEYNVRLLRYYFNIGDLYLLNNDIEKAKLKYTKGLELTKYILNNNHENISKISLDYYLGYFIGKIAICDIKNGKYSESIPALIRNIKLNIRDITNKKIIWTELANCYIKLKNKKLSYNAINKIRYYSNQASYDTISYSKTLAEYFEMNGEYDSSNYYLKIFQNQNEQLFNKIINNKATYYLIKYENEKLNNHLNIEKVKYANLFIILLITALVLSLLTYFYLIKTNNFNSLIKVNKELTLITNELTLSNKNKNLLLKELNHRVKNNLQLINSFMNIKMRDYEYNADINNFVDEIQKRVMVISSIYEIIYKTDSYEYLNLEILIPKITSNIIQLFQHNNFRFKITYQIDSICVPSNIGLFLCLIINEAISNSLKYAFDNKSTNNLISINILKTNDHEFYFTISDNGYGIKNDNKKYGFGMNFMKLISQQLKAEYKLYSSNDGVIHNFKIDCNV